VCTASAPDMGKLQSSLYTGGDTLLFSGAATEAVPTFASPANRAPPVATVMPLHSSYNFPSSSVLPTADWSEPQAAVTAEASIGSRRTSAPSAGSAAYFPVTFRWFYCRNVELRQIWQPFSVMDSTNLELAHQSLVSGMFGTVCLLIFLVSSVI